MTVESCKWIEVEIGGPDDPWRDFPSSTSAVAKRKYDETGEVTVIKTVGHLAISFIEAHCVLTDSRFAGEPFILMEWQKRWLVEQYEVVQVVDNNDQPVLDYVLKHRWAFIGIPKKNGKTESVAALGLYHGLREKSAAVAIAAVSDTQADLLFSAAAKMVKGSPTLNRMCEVWQKEIETHGHAAAGSIKRLAASTGSNDGKNLSAALIDELHEWTSPKSRRVYVTLTQGGGARAEPINIIITTAGHDQTSTCYELFLHLQRIMEGEIIDPAFYGLWFGAPADADYTDPAVWEQANPSWGVILSKPFYEDMITKRRESEFRRYFLNQWTEADEIWEVAKYWDDMAVDEVTLDPSKPLYVGIDIGRRFDAAAIVWGQEEEGAMKVLSKVWSNPYQPMDPRYREWKLSMDEVENHLRQLAADFREPAWWDQDEYPLPGPAFFYDPHFFSRSADDLWEEGLTMVEFNQTDSKMIPASQTLFMLAKEGKITHDGDPVLRRHIRSVVAKEKDRGWRISRPPGARKPNDAAVALAMLCYGALTLNNKPKLETVEIW